MIREKTEAIAVGTKYQQVRAHVQRNKPTYIAGISGVAVGAVGVVLLNRSGGVSIVNTIAPVFNNDNSSTVNFGGYMHKLVKCVETGEIWETVREAASAKGVYAPVMSKHLNGHTDHIKGLHFEIIGVGTSV
jgi:hypothetical protein